MIAILSSGFDIEALLCDAAIQGEFLCARCNEREMKIRNEFFSSSSPHNSHFDVTVRPSLLIPFGVGGGVHQKAITHVPASLSATMCSIMSQAIRIKSN